MADRPTGDAPAPVPAPLPAPVPTPTVAEGDVLGSRALGRALLARQMLLARARIPALDALERLVGMQAQAPASPYVGLWTRLEDFAATQLSDLISTRAAVRVVAMRSTIHLLSARDCLALRPVLQPVQDRSLWTGSPFGRQLAGMDIDELVAAGRSIVERQPCTTAELGAALGERWPDRDPASMAAAIRNLVPLVQIPPRGLWGRGGRAICTTAEAWLGQPLGTDPTPDALVLRYLAAFGPATVADLRTWSGLTRLGPVIERLRPGLCTFVDGAGRELFDRPNAPRPDPDTPAPVRFLPEFDNLLLSHADRTRVMTEAARAALADGSVIRSSVLVDGFVHGVWKVHRERKRATLAVTLFSDVTADQAVDLTAEGRRLLRFVAAPIPSHDVDLHVGR
ncbi:MAG: winged helix DNA-binding domain-containing protein [Frankia sp.]